MARGRKKKDRQELSPLELEVMTVVWELRECSSAEVIETFQQRRKLARTTIRTVLANIEKKGYLERVPSTERGFRYQPLQQKEAVARKSLRQLVRRLFGGSPKHAIVHLLQNEELDDEDLQEIREMLDSQHSRGEEP